MIILQLFHISTEQKTFYPDFSKIKKKKKFMYFTRICFLCQLRAIELIIDKKQAFNEPPPKKKKAAKFSFLGNYDFFACCPFLTILQKLSKNPISDPSVTALRSPGRADLEKREKRSGVSTQFLAKSDFGTAKRQNLILLRLY